MKRPDTHCTEAAVMASGSIIVEQKALYTDDGVALAAKTYTGPGTVGMTILMLPGIGVPQRAFRHMARWFAERGARCVTVDYRGMGDSRTPRGVATASLSAWAKHDAVAALEYAESSWPEPVTLIGHSFGGQVVGLASAFQRVQAAAFIGSQFGLPRYWDGWQRYGLASYWFLVLPALCAFFRVLPAWSGPAGPLPRGVAREWSRWGRSSNWYLSSEPEAAALLRAFPAPLMAYGIVDDNIAPPRAVSALLERFSATGPIRRDIAPDELGLPRIGHTGLFRPSPETAPVWQEMLSFLREHTVAQDHGAGRLLERTALERHILEPHIGKQAAACTN